MKIYVVWLDGEREYASDKWLEARERCLMLENNFGVDRVEMTIEYL